MGPSSLDDLLARYAELDALIERAVAACAVNDRDQAVLLGFAITQKLTTLDERLLEMGIVPDGVQVPSDL